MSDGSTPAEAPDPADMAAAMAAAQAAAEAEAAARAKTEADALAASLAALAAANAQAAPTLFHDDTVAAPRGSFGPTFPAELAAAGVAGLAYAYGAATISFAPTIAAEDRAKVMAVVATHDPAQPRPEPVPSSVTDYQFAGQACAEGIIDFEAAKAWTGSGIVPKVLLDAVDALVTDTERHDRVVLFLMGTKDFPRNHELTPVLAAIFGKDTPEKLDAFFVAASKR